MVHVPGGGMYDVAEALAANGFTTTLTPPGPLFAEPPACMGSAFHLF